jgi:hypothetical protein
METTAHSKLALSKSLPEVSTKKSERIDCHSLLGRGGVLHRAGSSSYLSRRIERVDCIVGMKTFRDALDSDLVTHSEVVIGMSSYRSHEC